MRRISISLMVLALLVVGALPAFAQTTEPADYAAEVSTFAGTVAANVWPIALGLLTAFIGITLGVRGLKAGFHYLKRMVRA